MAGHGSAADPISQGKARLLPATPTFTGRPNTELAAFGGIDAKQSNAPAMDFDGVAIDDGRDPDNAILCGRAYSYG